MGKKFFSGWELWQQMTFVLACGIVATIFLGLCKLQYDKYKLRKYDKVDKGKQAQTPEMLEAQPIKQEDDVPFGIRAIESGIEVDGVWISRSNTPVTSSRSSINEMKLSNSHNSSQLELPKAAHASSSRASSRAPSSAFDRAVSAERIPTNDSRSSSPGRENANPFRGRPPVYPRYSNPNLSRNSTTLQALEGLDSGSSSTREPATAQPSSSNSGKSSIRTSDESDYMRMSIPEDRPYEAAYINPRTSTALAPVDPRTDLDLLQSHRLSHVAETGQLTPRVRRPGQSGEWASAADNVRSPQEISTANGVDYFVPLPRQKTPSPPLAPVLDSPEEMPVPSTSKISQDGHSTNKAKQAVPLLESYQTQDPPFAQVYQPRGPQHEYEETQHAFTTPQAQRQDPVLRKVNSGFEILRPGTFGEPPSPEEDQKANGEKRQSKRLQKKRRPSDGSRASNFVEQV